MAILDSSDPKAQLRGKVGGMVYAQQPDGTLTVRSAGVRTAEPTEGEQKGQHRMKLSRPYVRGVLGDPAARASYVTEAAKRKMRPCDLVVSDFMTDPVIAGVDTTKFTGLAAGWLLVLTGDDFKVIRVGVVVRDAAGRRIEEGMAVPADGSTAKAWIYSTRKDLPTGQTLKLEVTATDRAGHSAISSTTHQI